MNKKTTILSLIIIALSISYLLFRTIYIWNFTVDDSYITFRYSKNLAEGFGPTYNHGLGPIEGYTSFSWMVILSIPFLLHIDPVLFSKILGVICTLVYIFLSVKLAFLFSDLSKKSINKLNLITITVFFLSILPLVPLHAVSGMETALITAVITGLLYCFIRLIKKPSMPLLLITCFIGLVAGLTRPEANFLVVIGFFYLLWSINGNWRGKVLINFVLIYFIPGLLYFIWRFLYYQVPLPLSFYVKTLGKSLAGIPNVFAFLKAFCSIILLVCTALYFKHNKSILFFCIILIFPIFFLFPEHVMGYGYRFLFPIIPSLTAFGAYSIVYLVSANLKIQKKFLKYELSAILYIIIFWCGFSYFTIGQQEYEQRRLYYFALENAHVKLGKAIAQIKLPDSSQPLLALSDAGAIPYFSGWNTIDLFGLNNVEIGFRKNKNPNYVLSQHPTFIILDSADDTNLQAFFPENEVLYEAAIMQGMEKIFVMTFSKDGLYLIVLGYPGNIATDQLLKILNSE